MDIFEGLKMIGGLALFLYGMDQMGVGLSKMAGGKMQYILSKLTSNIFVAILLGTAVTAVIQSSSATTVMVVGFVNSGIMPLSGVVGVIMGANIGTTATSWILSLTGIEGDNFLLQMCKPASFTPILAITGIVLIMFTKTDKKKAIGTVLIGFTILMFGMETMSGAVKGLKDVPGFTDILTKFSNPILGMLAGAILTAIIQSSSASVGILQALCSTGRVKFNVAIPIIMGQNIGTCITAMLSSIGASKNAKRAAFIHLYFNLIGTIVFMILFYSANMILDFGFLNDAASEVGIATVHSIFNIFATVAWLPFNKYLLKLAEATVKDGAVAEKQMDEVDKELQVLEERFLDNPSFAVAQCQDVAKKMALLSKRALLKSIKLLDFYSEDGKNEVMELETAVDRFEDRLGTYMVKISEKELSTKDSHIISLLLHSIGDFERISDHAVNIAQVAKKMSQSKQEFSNKAKEELEVLLDAVREILETSVEIFCNGDTAKADTIEPLEEVIDNLNAQLKKRHIKRLRKGKCTIELGLELTEITTNMERVSDHCSNIAVCLIQINENSFDTHEYLDNIKKDNPEFKHLYNNYLKKYQLP